MTILTRNNQTALTRGVSCEHSRNTDGSSCGPMVVRNAALRMNGFSVGSWHDMLDAEHLSMDIVEAFEIYISDNAMQPKRGRENQSSTLSYGTALHLEDAAFLCS